MKFWNQKWRGGKRNSIARRPNDKKKDGSERKSIDSNRREKKSEMDAMETIMRTEREDRVAAEERTVKEHCVRMKTQEEAIRKDREVWGLEAECRRRGPQIDAIHDIAEQRYKDALRTGK